jgi:hypothetical protein
MKLAREASIRKLLLILGITLLGIVVHHWHQVSSLVFYDPASSNFERQDFRILWLASAPPQVPGHIEKPLAILRPGFSEPISELGVSDVDDDDTDDGAKIATKPNHSAWKPSREDARARLFVPFEPGMNNCVAAAYAPKDGFGSQLQVMYTIIAEAAWRGQKACLRSVSRMHAAPKDIPVLLGMTGFVFQNFSACDGCSVVFRKHFRFKRDTSSRHLYFNSSVLSLFRAMYSPPAGVSLQEKPSWFQDCVECTSVAVHLRVYNSFDTSTRPKYNFDKYKSRIEHIRASFPRPRFYLFLQTPKNATDEPWLPLLPHLPQNDTVILLDTDTPKTFDAMVRADVLVQSSSSFSYMAGYLREKNVYYFSKDLGALDYWTVVD